MNRILTYFTKQLNFLDSCYLPGHEIDNQPTRLQFSAWSLLIHIGLLNFKSMSRGSRFGKDNFVQVDCYNSVAAQFQFQSSCQPSDVCSMSSVHILLLSPLYFKFDNQLSNRPKLDIIGQIFFMIIHSVTYRMFACTRMHISKMSSNLLEKGHMNFELTSFHLLLTIQCHWHNAGVLNSQPMH